MIIRLHPALGQLQQDRYEFEIDEQTRWSEIHFFLSQTCGMTSTRVMVRQSENGQAVVQSDLIACESGSIFFYSFPNSVDVSTQTERFYPTRRKRKAFSVYPPCGVSRSKYLKIREKIS
jgi:hypothetical protein